MAILITFSGFKPCPHPGYIVAPLNKMLFDDYLLGWFEQAANLVDENLKKAQKHWITGNSPAGANFSKHKVVIAIKV